jgi:hypothetical protein
MLTVTFGGDLAGGLRKAFPGMRLDLVVRAIVRDFLEELPESQTKSRTPRTRTKQKERKLSAVVELEDGSTRVVTLSMVREVLAELGLKPVGPDQALDDNVVTVPIDPAIVPLLEAIREQDLASD